MSKQLTYRCVKVIPADVKDIDYVLSCGSEPINWNYIFKYLGIQETDIPPATQRAIESYAQNVVNQNNYVILSKRITPVFVHYTVKKDKEARKFYTLDTANHKAYMSYNLPINLTHVVNYEQTKTYCEADVDVVSFEADWDVFGQAVNSRTVIDQSFDDDYTYYVQYSSYYNAVTVTRSSKKANTYITQVFYPDQFVFESGAWDANRLTCSYLKIMHSLLLFLAQHAVSIKSMVEHMGNFPELFETKTQQITLVKD